MPSRSKFPRAVENHFAEDIGDDAGARIGRAAESRMNFVVQRVEPGRIAEISQRPKSISSAGTKRKSLPRDRRSRLSLPACREATSLQLQNSAAARTKERAPPLPCDRQSAASVPAGANTFNPCSLRRDVYAATVTDADQLARTGEPATPTNQTPHIGANTWPYPSKLRRRKRPGRRNAGRTYKLRNSQRRLSKLGVARIEQNLRVTC